MADSVGRLSKTVFIGTSSALLGLSLISSLVRFYIRFYLQREIGWDDAFLIIGLCCLVSGMAMLLTVIDVMYESESLAFADARSISAINFMELIPNIIRYKRMSAAALSLLWCSICCVKFSFLALFKRMIRQMPVITRYWWFALVFNIAAWVYGVLSYFVSCPYFTEANVFKAIQCVQPAGLTLTVNIATSQMILDIVGDLFILVIPVILIWQIRVRWTQKIAISLTLCLTVIMVAVTITRIAGLKWKGKLDYVWESYFIAIAAEIGLVLGAITAFRALYVSKAKGRQVQKTTITFNWYRKGNSALLNAFGTRNGKGDSGVEPNEKRNRILPNAIPNATMTGVRTFMEENGRSTASDSTDGKERI
ncbi:hypothetical protein DM02DRAFT_571731 [Periconia macrospinosa]|uniref:Rhodopsin domain-containing protein n=1 Tax=Periconia macrospinosa TaxID=97972 RepID=A0A2V1DAF2_9PLEO|nr:hypothetical protein DM02DRAFT_571731 [Periconia macrospinosa]